jgi:hypothetical protein
MGTVIVESFSGMCAGECWHVLVNTFFWRKQKSCWERTAIWHRKLGSIPVLYVKREWGGTQYSSGLVKGECIRNAVVLKDG